MFPLAVISAHHSETLYLPDPNSYFPCLVQLLSSCKDSAHLCQPPSLPYKINEFVLFEFLDACRPHCHSTPSYCSCIYNYPAIILLNNNLSLLSLDLFFFDISNTLNMGPSTSVSNAPSFLHIHNHCPSTHLGHYQLFPGESLASIPILPSTSDSQSNP